MTARPPRRDRVEVTEADAFEMRALLSAGLSLRAVAKKVGRSPSVVKRFVDAGTAWRAMPPKALRRQLSKNGRISRAAQHEAAKEAKR